MPSRTTSAPTLSAVIIAINEAELLPGCLGSLSWCDEIVVVVDDRTTDETEAIAKRAGAKTVSRRFDDFASQKNYGIEQAKSDWILIMDADERVAPALRAEIQGALTLDAWGYRIPTKPYVFGVEIKHSGWAPSYQLRLFRANGHYSGGVHEQITPQGPVQQLKQPFIHYNYTDIRHWLDQMNDYTTREASKLHKAGVRFKPSMVVTKPAREFAYRFIKQSGWRDGFMGWVIALLMAAYRLSVVLKLWELDRNVDAMEIYHRLDRELLDE
jgi:glycosyltransferase involved in cell wall biosynthesis